MPTPAVRDLLFLIPPLLPADPAAPGVSINGLHAKIGRYGPAVIRQALVELERQGVAIAVPQARRRRNEPMLVFRMAAAVSDAKP